MFHLWELFLFIVQFSVEGAWTTWDNWGACSGREVRHVNSGEVNF